MTLLRIDASIKGPMSASAELADIVLAEWSTMRPDEPVVRRHLGVDPFPSTDWVLANYASWKPADQRSESEWTAVDLAMRLAQELRDADAAVFAFPLYNWGVSAHVKAWVDLVIAGAENTNERLLDGKPVVLVTTRGAGYGPGMPRAGWDNNTPYLRRILGDLWGADVTAVVEREFLFVGPNPAYSKYVEEAEASKRAALDAASLAGKALHAAY
jgi:FMN-dependent NADH-azoreductase